MMHLVGKSTSEWKIFTADGTHGSESGSSSDDFRTGSSCFASPDYAISRPRRPGTSLRCGFLQAIASAGHRPFDVTDGGLGRGDPLLGVGQTQLAFQFGQCQGRLGVFVTGA